MSSPSHHHMSLSFTKGVISPVRDAHIFYEKEKQKTKKWLQNKEAVEKMTLAKLNQFEAKRSKSQEKEKKAEKFMKQAMKKKTEQFKKRRGVQHTALLTVKEKERQQFERRQQQQSKFHSQFVNIVQNKRKKQKEVAVDNYEKMNARIQSAARTSSKFMLNMKTQSKKISQNLKEIDQKLAKSMKKNHDNKIQRIRAASAHFNRVNQRNQFFKQQCNDQIKSKLERYIQKHKAAEQRRNKLSKQRDKHFQKHKKQMNNRFEQVKYKQESITQQIKEKNENLLQKFDNHSKNVEQTRKHLEHIVKLKEERDKLKKNDQLENLFREKRNMQRFKYNIMNKHMNIDKQVQLLKDTKQELINYKLKRDQELKKYGSLRIPNPLDFDSKNLSLVKKQNLANKTIGE